MEARKNHAQHLQKNGTEKYHTGLLDAIGWASGPDDGSPADDGRLVRVFRSCKEKHRWKRLEAGSNGPTLASLSDRREDMFEGRGIHLILGAWGVEFSNEDILGKAAILLGGTTVAESSLVIVQYVEELEGMRYQGRRACGKEIGGTCSGWFIGFGRGSTWD